VYACVSVCFKFVITNVHLLTIKTITDANVGCFIFFDYEEYNDNDLNVDFVTIFVNF